MSITIQALPITADSSFTPQTSIPKPQTLITITEHLPGPMHRPAQKKPTIHGTQMTSSLQFHFLLIPKQLVSFGGMTAWGPYAQTPETQLVPNRRKHSLSKSPETPNRAHPERDRGKCDRKQKISRLCQACCLLERGENNGYTVTEG